MRDGVTQAGDRLEGWQERRGEGPREEIAKRCKLIAAGWSSCVPGRTLDVSAGGVRVEVRTSRSLRAGQVVEVAVCEDGEVLVRRASARAGRVLRAGPLEGGRQVVAVEYEAQAGLGEIVVRGAAMPERRSAA